jgi:serine/threonine protein kinase
MAQLQPNTEFGAYRIVRHIAGGGMAQIYLAKVEGLAGFEKQLALKVINPEYADEDRFIQMLIDEAKITVELSHVNIGQVFDLGQVEGIYFIAMEFVDGLDVLELVNGLHAVGERVPCEAVALIGRQICSGLHYAHTKKDAQAKPLNIVHRDISPQNILVSRAGEVKVVDFGIAKAAGVSSKTQAGVIKGKVHYMSPEQAMGKKADRRSDIFATGIVLWEMLTSQMVYSGDNVRELVERVRLAKIAPPSKNRPDVPQALERIVMKALSRRPEDRFTSAHAFQIELTKFLSSSAPDYGASHLAELVERIVSKKYGTVRPQRMADEEHLSREDMIQDIHSVIAATPEEPLDQARLLVETGQGQTIRTLDDELVMGRAGQLAIPDARVSRRHARIQKTPSGNYTLEDLGSANGTFVNDERLAAIHLLQDKDEIRIGSFRMTFRLPDLSSTYKSAPPKAVPLLLVTCGTRTIEHILDQEFSLSYCVHVGPVCLDGVAGRVVRKNDDFWLEPLPGRQPVTFNGAETTSPVRLTPGDSFQVGEFRFEFRHEPPAT